MTHMVLPTWRVELGDALAVLREMPSESVHMVVTSPPYFGLRNYGTGQWEGGDAGCSHEPPQDWIDHNFNANGVLGNGHKGQSAAAKTRWYKPDGSCPRCGAKRIDGQIGLEGTPAEYIAALVGVFREVRRVLRRDGTCWVNMGDSYAGSGASNGEKQFVGNVSTRRVNKENGKKALGTHVLGLKPKDLMMMPARVAIALQDDGWYLRSEITWCKRAPMPESVTDRPTSATEKIFLLAREQRYFYDSDAVRERVSASTLERWDGLPDRKRPSNGLPNYTQIAGESSCGVNPNGRNLWNYWLLSPEPYPEAHFATFPTEIPRRAIRAGTSEWGCCPECGAQWRRVVERTFEPTQDPRYLKGGTKGMDKSNGWGDVPRGRTNNDTTGWQATCAHKDLAPVPCTVLDPFSGAGTTGLVALELGRNYIGIELNEEYVELSRRRIQKEMPLIAWGAGV